MTRRVDKPCYGTVNKYAYSTQSPGIIFIKILLKLNLVLWLYLKHKVNEHTIEIM